MSGRSPRVLAELAAIHARRGDRDAARAILTELEQRATNSFVEHSVLGSIHACLGEMAEARRLVALGVEQHEIWWQFAKSAAWAPFRADAEGAAMLGKLGFA
jgi:ATP/maltotriose-dependent transcriptional regulator MalT